LPGLRHGADDHWRRCWYRWLFCTLSEGKPAPHHEQSRQAPSCHPPTRRVGRRRYQLSLT
jgi:hypothetical protein